ncbi:MAG: heliorhodopsin HeR [Thermoleophilia bacterium]|nr:heliorhodopsin HeR [Thermoleophilia bacterium]
MSLDDKVLPRRLPDLPSFESLGRLRVWNLAAFALHAASGIVIVMIGNGLTFPVNAAPSQGPPGAANSWPVEHLFDVRVAWAAAAFAFLSAIAHLLASTVLWKRYTADLQRGINQLRWIEYALSSTLMILLIAQLTGIFDIAALIGIAGANIAMNLFGWANERHNLDRRGLLEHGASLWSFWLGCVPAIAPWAAIVTYLALAGNAVPNFVYGIFVSLFVFFNCFAAVMLLEYRRIGPWRSVRFTEKTYIVLSFTAKLALTWQIAANVLL